MRQCAEHMTQLPRLKVTGQGHVIYPSIPVRSITQSVMCLASDASWTADPVVMSSIPARSHTFVEIDYEIISTIILLPSAESFKIVISYKGKYVHKVLVNCLFKLAQEKSMVR